MKVWRSVRHQASAASASPSRCSGHGAGSTRSGWACRRGWRAIVQTKRSQRSLPVTRRARCDAAPVIRRLSATGACTSANERPDLALGRPVRRQRDGEPGDGGVAAIDDREVFGKGERQQRGATPTCGQRQQAFADLGPRRAAGLQLAYAARGIDSPAEDRRAPRRAVDREGLRMLARRVARQRVERRPASKPSRDSSACAGKACSTASFSRRWHAVPRSGATLGVSCAAPSASRRSPGCMRNGALTAASKSNDIRRSCRDRGERRERQKAKPAPRAG